MTKDLIERLRDESWKAYFHPMTHTELEVWHKTTCEAANEIVRLRTVVDHLTARLSTAAKAKEE